MASPDDQRSPPATDTDANGDEVAAKANVDDDTDADSVAEATAGSSGREVVVPLRLYKTITVFSTLIAVVSILAGFVILDRATQRATVSPEDINLVLALLAVGLIVGGSAVYAFSTRFRTAEMGKSKDATDEGSDNG